MGFFSKLKKAWASPEDVAQQALDEYKKEQGIEIDEKVDPEPKQAAPVEEAAETPVAPSTDKTDAAPTPSENWQAGLTLSLRQAEPKLSQWLNIIVEGVDEKGQDLWDRLGFLFKALGAPENEAQEFIKKFDAWLGEMGYVAVAEFKSELQYRLALALDLEDEEDERDRLFLKLSEGISKTREQITKRVDGLVSSHSKLDDDFWEEFEEILIMADVGMEAANQLMDNLKRRAKKAGTDNPDDFKDILRDELEEIFKVPPRIEAVNPPEVLMMVGVNGVGKTTTIGKIANKFTQSGSSVLLAACDTFRAAAVAQLKIWGERNNVEVISHKQGADPSSVAFDAIAMAQSKDIDVVLVDTAGRMHTKDNLMEELKKIKRVMGKKLPGAPHEVLLVIDATTGQNGISQAKLFDAAVDVTGITLTKLDGTSKGGIVVNISREMKIPIRFIGIGEQMDDLRDFDPTEFVDALFDSPGTSSS